MEPLRLTPIPNPPLPASPAGQGLASWLRRRDCVLRILATLSVLSLLLTLMLGALLLVLVGKRTQFAVLDRAGNVQIAEGTSFAQARELHTEMGLLATTALLSRGPKDFDLAELLPRLFSRPTQALAQRLHQNEQPDFEQRQLRQKPEITRLEAQRLEPASVELNASGQVVRSGLFAGQPILEVLPFTLRLTLTRNPDLLQAGRYPVVVTAFTLTYEKPRS